MIDERIRHVGTSYLRKFNAGTLRLLNERVYVIRESSEPIAVVMSYEMFMQMEKQMQMMGRMQ